MIILYKLHLYYTKKIIFTPVKLKLFLMNLEYEKVIKKFRALLKVDKTF